MRIRLAIVLFLLSVMTVPLCTCSCIGGPTPIAESRSRYELVALALCETVTQDSVKDTKSPRGYTQYLTVLKARMCVLVSVKGTKTLQRIETITAVGKGSCGISMREGETYYIAADRITPEDRVWVGTDEEPPFILNRCSGSRVVNAVIIDTVMSLVK